MTCFLTVILAACSALDALPGTPPACEGDTLTMAVVRANIPDDPEAANPLPIDPGFEVRSERRPAEGCTETPTLVSIAEHYPACVVGHVQRAEVTHGEGDDAITIPAREPYHGVCCSQGCKLAGAGEHIPFGTPIGYAEARAGRYAPEGGDGD